jgi:hypothetical protein
MFSNELYASNLIPLFILNILLPPNRWRLKFEKIYNFKLISINEKDMRIQDILYHYAKGLYL